MTEEGIKETKSIARTTIVMLWIVIFYSFVEVIRHFIAEDADAGHIAGHAGAGFCCAFVVLFCWRAQKELFTEWLE